MILNIIAVVIALIAIGLCIWNHTRIKRLERYKPGDHRGSFYSK